MKKMSSNDLMTRINRFKDSKKSKVMDLTEIAGYKIRRSHRQMAEVSDMPYIELAVK